MKQFLFEGIGTHWKVIYFLPEKGSSRASNKAEVKKAVLSIVKNFDQTYSRFKSNSLVSQIARSSKTTHHISQEFTDILEFGQQLIQLTDGQFNPAVGTALENLGYDASYSFTPKSQPNPVHLEWNIQENTLTTPYPVLLDIGGWGKGYLIDKIAHMLEEGFDIHHYLVDGGGDVYATTKPDNSPWIVALEHPTQPNQAFGKIEIKYQAIASSGTSKRSFGDSHHLLDATSQTPVRDLLGVHVLGNNATIADGAATALFVSDTHHYNDIQQAFNIEYLMVQPNLQYKKTAGFTADIFT